MESKTILYLEDNQLDIELTLEVFKENHILNKIVIARDGVEGLEYLRCTGRYKDRAPGNPGMILLDLKMPRLGGLEFLGIVKQDMSLKQIPIIILTASREEQDLLTSYSLRVNAYVVKPVDFNSFRDVIKQIGLFWAITNEVPSNEIVAITNSPKNKKNILKFLLLEDSNLDRRLICNYLNESFPDKVQTDVAINKAEFVLAISKNQYDLIISDFTLPDINGFDALALIQSINPLLPLIIVSGPVGEETAVSLLNHGVIDFFFKDRFGGLKKSIERVLQETNDRKNRIQTNIELKQMESLLRASLGSPKDFIILAVDTNYHYLYLNDTHKNLVKQAYGKDIEVGMNLLNAITSKVDKENSKKNFDLAMTGVFHSTIQESNNLAKKYYESFYSPLYNENEDLIGATMYAHDITEQMNAQQQLKASEEKYHLLYSSMSQGMALYEIITDDTGKPIDFIFLDINDSYLQLFGLKSENCIGKRITEVMPKIENYWIEVFGKVALTGVPIYYENYLETTGRFYATYSYCPKPRQFAVLITDITEKLLKLRQIEYLSYHDFLTDLHNRRSFVNTFGTLNTPNHFPLGIMMFDVNGLKIINDAYGHDIGDLALKFAATLLSQTFEKKDVVARIGGDEFAVLLPNTTLEKMYEYKTVIQLGVAQKTIMNIPLSLAIGYEIMTETNMSLDDLLKLAENHMYRHKLAEGVGDRNNAIRAILKTLTEKYEPERVHSTRVSAYCRKVGEALQLKTDDLEELAMAALFHDIGKISIPDAIIQKTGKLTPEEFEIMKTHTEIGYQILRAADQYSDLAIHALSHHERWDGKGYPRGLKGEQIPFFSRIVCVADSFEAMTAARLYKKKMTIEEAKKELVKYSGSQFDPKIVKIFIEKVLPKS